MIEACNNCMHYKPNEMNDGQNGLCRRHPATLDNEGVQRHPIVRHDDRCGEFRHMGNLNPGQCFACLWFQAEVTPMVWMETAALRPAVGGREEAEIGYCGKGAPKPFVLRDEDGDEHPCFQAVVTADYFCGDWSYDYTE